MPTFAPVKSPEEESVDGEDVVADAAEDLELAELGLEPEVLDAKSFL
jgi:hypothetical protein